MSLLDDENILIDDLRAKINNPFFHLKQIFIQTHDNYNGLLIPYKKEIDNILKGVEIPEHTKWYINYRTIELVDPSYYGEPGDYYKIFCSIDISGTLKSLIIDRKISSRYTGSNVYNQIHDMLDTVKYGLRRLSNNMFVYRDL